MKMRILNGKLVDAPHALSAWERRGESGGKEEGREERKRREGRAKVKAYFLYGDRKRMEEGGRRKAARKKRNRKEKASVRGPSVRLPASNLPSFASACPSIRPSSSVLSPDQTAPFLLPPRPPASSSWLLQR